MKRENAQQGVEADAVEDRIRKRCGRRQKEDTKQDEKGEHAAG